jgi:hypothetical protein
MSKTIMHHRRMVFITFSKDSAHTPKEVQKRAWLQTAPPES